MANAGAAAMAAGLAPVAAPAPAPAGPSAQDLKRAERKLTEYAEGRGRPLGAGTKNPDGTWSRGLAILETRPHPEGLEVTIYSGHTQADDHFNLKLYLNIDPDLSGPLPEQTVEIPFLAGALKANPRGQNGEARYEGINTFVLREADINAYLRQHAPQASEVRVGGGRRLILNVQWANSHHWGNTDRHGTFRWPAAGGAQGTGRTAVSTQTGATFEEDLAVPYDNVLRSQFPVLAHGGDYQSHIESEFKARVPLSRFREVYDQLVLLTDATTPAAQAPRQALMTTLFGSEAADWTVEKVEKYWEKDAQGHHQQDPQGFLAVPFFNDLYYDNQGRVLAQHRVALRMREVTKQNLQQDWLNVKPGPGATDPSANVNRRVEIAMPLVRGARQNTTQLRQFLSDYNEPLNPFNRIRELILGLEVMQAGKPETDVLQPATQIIGRRYKFDLKHKSGMSIELSLDNVMAVALGPDGMPLRVDAQGNANPNGQFIAVSCFGQFEAELNHLNVTGTGSALANAALWGRGQAAPAGGAPPQASSTPQLQSYPGSIGPQQEQWLASLPKDAAVSGAARIHTLADLQHPSLTQSPDQQTFVAVAKRVQTTLLGAIGRADGAMPSEQKSAMGGMLAGVVPMTAEERRLYAEELGLGAKLRAQLSTQLAQVQIQAATAIAQVKQQAEQYFVTQTGYAESARRNRIAYVDQNLQSEQALAVQHEARAAGLSAGPPRDRWLKMASDVRAAATQRHATALAQAETQYRSVIDAAKLYGKGLVTTAQAQARESIAQEIMKVNALSLLRTSP